MSPFAVTSPIDEAPEDRRADDEGFCVSLRYLWQAGAPNVVILLNGRFATRTNGEGRFEIPPVAEGEHVLTVVKDNGGSPGRRGCAGLQKR